MANERYTQLPIAIGLDGTEWVPLDQSNGDGTFTTKRTTSQGIANLAVFVPTGVTPGSYGDSTHVGAFTVNAFGQLTAASSIAIGAGGIGTVTNVSVTSANGFAGTVATSSTTPVITLSTTVTGILVGDGTGISAASTTGSGGVVLATSPTITSPTLVTPNIGAATGTSLNLGGLTVSEIVGTDGSKNLVSVATTGSGNVVLATAPTLVTPVLGVASATTLNKVTITQPAVGSTLTIQNGFTLTVSGNAIVTGNNTGDQTITLTGDVTGTGTSTFVTTIPAQTITYSKMQNIATASFIGRNTSGTGSPETLSATVATAILNVMVGDTGSGGTKGLVPAPAAGDAAASKYLAADGTWAVPAGSGAGTVNSVSVATANGFGGTVADPTNNAAITVKTTITGILSGNGTAVSAASTTGSGNVVLATSPTLVTPALGTPSAVVLTNGTGLPISSGVSGLGTGIATFLAVPTSANLAAALTDETGTGLAVFSTSPTLVTPALGVATATSINKVAITAPGTAATLTLVDGTTLTGPASSGTVMTLDNPETVTGAKTFNSGTVVMAGSSSGTTALNPSAVASGTLTLPAATDTLIGKATTDTLTNKTLTSPVINTGLSGTAFGTGVATWLTTPTSANLRSALTDETGTGAAYFQSGDLGTPSAGVMTNVTGTAASLTAGTATVANGLKSATTTVVVSGATAPSAGKVLTATSSTAADWETPSGGPTVVLKTSQQTANDATLANDNALFFTVAANTDYVFYFFIPVTNSTSTNAGGAQFAVTTPSGTIAYGVIVQDSNGANSAGSTASSGTGFGLTGSINTTMVGIVTGSVQVGVTGGTLQLQFAQNTAVSGHVSTFKVGAYGTLTPSP